MTKFGITGSLASGKTTASQIVSKKSNLLFSADKVVKKLYKKKYFKKIIATKLKISINSNFKSSIKKKLYQDKQVLKKIEKIAHPLVRKEMKAFLKKNKNKKHSFCEIPLLVESNLMNYFDVVIFIKSKKRLRLKRYKAKGGTTELFKLLDKQQQKDKQKIRYCDYVVVNNSSLTILKKKLFNIMKNYE